MKFKAYNFYIIITMMTLICIKVYASDYEDRSHLDDFRFFLNKLFTRLKTMVYDTSNIK